MGLPWPDGPDGQKKDSYDAYFEIDYVYKNGGWHHEAPKLGKWNVQSVKPGTLPIKCNQCSDTRIPQDKKAPPSSEKTPSRRRRGCPYMEADQQFKAWNPKYAHSMDTTENLGKCPR